MYDSSDTSLGFQVADSQQSFMVQWVSIRACTFADITQANKKQGLANQKCDHFLSAQEAASTVILYNLL